MRGAGHGHRPLLHGFEQGRLRLGGGAIDLVSQHEVSEDRPRLEPQQLGAAIVALDDHTPHDIGGHQIGRELDARIL